MGVVPGTEVPRATKAMALTESLRKMKQPKWPAISPMMAVTKPIMRMETTKVKYPLNRSIAKGVNKTNKSKAEKSLKLVKTSKEV